jgi:hypothetical protein
MPMGGWTRPADVVGQVERLWARGRLLGLSESDDPFFPFLLRFRGPTRQELGSRFEEARAWIRELEAGSTAHGYEVSFEEIAHRQLGANRIPSGIFVPTQAVALRMIGRVRSANRFHALRQRIGGAFPALGPWIARNPMKVLNVEEEWAGLLEVLAWFRDHLRSGLYRRQLEIQGVDTKFIERHRGLLTELLSHILQHPASGMEKGVSFDKRFGLREKPFLVRFRLLDEALRIQGLADLTVPVEDLAQLDLRVDDVIVTENEVNGLTLPARSRTLVLFGQGYAVERLAEVHWLARRRLLYWGDIDTHGFAMLDRFRRVFPGAASLMMDRATLLEHEQMWVEERDQYLEALRHLDASEDALHRELLSGVHGDRVRLEQERIGFGWVKAALARLAG